MGKPIYVANDNLVQLFGLKDERTNAYVSGATVTAQLRDAAGVAVGGAITLTYVAGSNGDYAGVVPDTTALVAGDRYTAEITADNGADQRGFWTLALYALAREA